MNRFVRRLISLFRAGRAEDDLLREVASHLAALEDEYGRRGLTRDEARARAPRDACRSVAALRSE